MRDDAKQTRLSFARKGQVLRESLRNTSRSSTVASQPQEIPHCKAKQIILGPCFYPWIRSWIQLATARATKPVLRHSLPFSPLIRDLDVPNGSCPLDDLVSREQAWLRCGWRGMSCHCGEEGIGTSYGFLPSKLGHGQSIHSRPERRQHVGI
jgi:hypothetical protein